MLESRRRRRRIGKTTPGSSKSFSSFEEENDFSFEEDVDSRTDNFSESCSNVSNNRSLSTNEIDGPARLSLTSSFEDDESSPSLFSSDSKVSLKDESYSVSVNSFDSSRSKRKTMYASKSDSIKSDKFDIMNDTGGDEIVRGAIRDVYAVQDAGSYRLGYEHCSYLCSTISSIDPGIDDTSTASFEKDFNLSQESQSSLSVASSNSVCSSKRMYSNSTSTSGTEESKRRASCSLRSKKQNHTSITANAACELANMMSSSRQRSALLMSSSQSNGKIERTVCSGALIAILDALASAPIYSSKRFNLTKQNSTKNPPKSETSINDDSLKHNIGSTSLSHENDNTQSNKNIRRPPILRTRSSRTKSLRKKNEGKANPTVSFPTVLSKKDLSPNEFTSQANLYDHQTALALSIVAYFLSLEAMTSPFIRNSVLKHYRGLSGLSRLVNFDSFLYDHEIRIPLQNCIKRSIQDDTHKAKSDPTTSGRKNRKRRRIQKHLSDVTNTKNEEMSYNVMETIDENRTGSSTTRNGPLHASIQDNRSNLGPSSPLSFSSGSCSTNQDNNTFRKKLKNALALIQLPRKGREKNNSNLTSGFIALFAIKQITDRNTEQENESSNNVINDFNDNEETQNDSDNPFFVNNALRESGALPILADSMTNALLSAKYYISQLAIKGGISGDNAKYELLYHIHLRLDVLVSILDGACCLTDSNRQIVVDDTNLIQCLLHLVKGIVDLESSKFDEKNYNDNSKNKCIGDLLLSSLQTLTSLSHENFSAGMQLLRRMEDQTESAQASSTFMNKSGVGLIFDLLSSTATKRSKNNRTCDEKKMYDTIIFCLNTLTNVAETPELLERVQREILSATIVIEEEEEEDCESNSQIRGRLSLSSSDTVITEKPALQWLSAWLVKETESFRDLIVKGTFGRKKNTNHCNKNGTRSADERVLMKHEEESLVIAGNGFVLLACLMKCSQSSPACSNTLSTHVKKNILSQIPNDENTEVTGIMFMIKTLKAFLNFYHYSIGDLSVAVVEPVLKLISELEII